MKNNKIENVFYILFLWYLFVIYYLLNYKQLSVSCMFFLFIVSFWSSGRNFPKTPIETGSIGFTWVDGPDAYQLIDLTVGRPTRRFQLPPEDKKALMAEYGSADENLDGDSSTF